MNQPTAFIQAPDLVVKDASVAIPEWRELFTKLNEDTAPVSFVDVEYYTTQVYNMTDEKDLDQAQYIAGRL